MFLLDGHILILILRMVQASRLSSSATRPRVVELLCRVPRRLEKKINIHKATIMYVVASTTI
jgi:hypothetical protein